MRTWERGFHEHVAASSDLLGRIVESGQLTEDIEASLVQAIEAYNEVFGKFIDQYREACAGMKIDYRIARTDQPWDEFIRAYMTERQRLSK